MRWEKARKVGVGPKGEGNRRIPNRVTRFGIAGLEREKGRGGRAKKAKCELRWAGGQSRVGKLYAVWVTGVLLFTTYNQW